mmetsp:Transcript_17730/g.28841  ORF Transcript_17730/g.28841 Transcript_17730/m.28841 type:complete len:328 (-) Transcript_17730:239-1222(-)
MDSLASDDAHEAFERHSRRRRHGFANEGELAQLATDVHSVLFSRPVKEAKDFMLEARDTYLNDHGRARGMWAPTDRHLGLRVGGDEPTPKGFHEHFADMSAELEGLLIGGRVVTKDRVHREATMLANKGGDTLESEVDTVVRALRSEVAQRVDKTEVDAWGYIHFPQDIPDKEMRKRVFPYPGGKDGLLAATEEFATLHSEAFDSQVDQVVKELRGEVWGVAPELTGGGSLQSIQQDVEMLKQYVGKLKSPQQKHESFSVQVQKLRKTREQAAQAHEVLQKDLQARALEENLRMYFIGNDRHAPEDFPKSTFDCMSRVAQDRLIASM